MKFRIQGVISVLLLASISLNTHAGLFDKISSLIGSDKEKATIGVMAHSDFVPDRAQQLTTSKIGLPDLLADRIIEHLSNSQRFSVVERNALRRLVLEQRFGQDIKQTYLDRTLEKAIDDMEVVKAGTVGTTGGLSNYNDLLKDYQDLGSAVNADFLVLGDLEKLDRKTKTTSVPYSTEGRTQQQKLVDARLQIRVIDTQKGIVAGAISIRTKLKETLFEGKTTDSDQFTFFDHLGGLAATKILDITFPARIVNMEPIVISRGINDGVKKGDIYLIEREGKKLKDANGLVIGNLKTTIGKVEIDTPQETVAIVKSIEGKGFKVGDLAILDTDPEAVFVDNSIANVPIKKSSVAKQLPRVAVGLIKSGSTAKTGNDAQKHTPVFTDTMISRLAQTKRFQLIDRQEVDQLLKEQAAGAMSKNQDMVSAVGTLEGADYLIYGSLTNFSTEDKTIRLPNSTRTFKKKVGYVEGNMRIVDARTGDIIESRKIAVKQDIDASANGKRTATMLADSYAEQVTLMLMNAVYPIKVAHVSADGSVYINRGDDGGLYVGESLDGFHPGQPIIDPDTGIQLGVEETLTGQIKVTEVEDARSKGVVVEGGSFTKGDILKRTLSNKGKRSSEAKTAISSAPKRTGGDFTAKKNAQSENHNQQKPTLAMGLLRLNPSAKTTGLTKGHIKRMSDDLVLKLLNTNRFDLMERKEVDQILDEKAFEAVASDGDIQDRIKELQGADYLIHGELANFYLDVKKKNIPYVNKTQITVTGVAEGMFRIVDVHTGKVSSAEKVQIKDTVKNVGDANQIMSDLMDQFTTKSVAMIVSRLYPIKVLGMTADGIVYLNRGEDAGLKKGEHFDVMRPGQELIDTDTGRSFGSAEMKIGSVKIVAIEANRSRAQFVSGNDAKSGDVLRKSQIVIEKPKPKISKPAW